MLDVQVRFAKTQIKKFNYFKVVKKNLLKT